MSADLSALPQRTRSFLITADLNSTAELKGFGPVLRERPVFDESGQVTSMEVVEVPWEFDPMTVPDELQPLPEDHYEHYRSPSAFSQITDTEGRPVSCGFPLGWRLTAKGRELAAIIRAEATP